MGAEDLELNNYLRNSKNAIVIPPDNARVMATTICDMYEHPDAAEEIAEEGLITVRNKFYYKNYTALLTHYLKNL